MHRMPISNERPSPFGRKFPGRRPPFGREAPQPPPVAEDTLKSERIQIERKSYQLTLKENPRGRFLRISEESNGIRNNIIIPAPGLEAFVKAFDEMLKASTEIPPNPAA
jgi:hypothetical protein